MSEALFQGESVTSNRILHTPSAFARSSLLYLQETGRLQALKPHVSRRENLRSYLFFVVEQGRGTLTLQGQETALRAGDCVFLDCMQPYAQQTAPEDLWTLCWVHFDGPAMEGIYEKYRERGGQTVFHPDDIDSYLALLSDLYATAEAQDYILDMRINEKLSALLTLIMSESWHPENHRSGAKKQSLQQVKTYLEEHFSERITLDRLSEVFFINKYYLTRVFKEQYGTTILSYLDHLRITRAKQLLRFTDKTVEEIGCTVGIEEAGYFNRVFKKVEGVTPGEYRKLW